MNRSLPVLGTLLAASAPAQLGVVQQIQSTADPFVVEVADVNADTLPDLVALARSRSSVLVWQQLSGGLGFGLPTAVSTAPNDASYLAVGDLDNDRRLDLLVLGDTGGSGTSWGITVRLAGTGGSFQNQVTMALPMSGASDPGLADIDNDGNLDLVYVLVGPALVGVHLGSGNGLFGQGLLYPVWPVPVDLEIADLDGDGNLDLALAVVLADLVHVLWGDGTGAFPTSAFVPVSGREPAAVVAGDVDGDGDRDLLVAAARSGEVDVLRNDGARGFTETGRFFTRPSPTDLVLADLDGSGSPDVAVIHGGNPGYFAFLRGDGAGSFPMAYWFTLPSHDARAGTLADLDLDGRTEVLVPLDVGDTIVVIGDPLTGHPGRQLFGTGTPGCRGSLGLNGNFTPSVGAGSFAFVASNAPPETVGLVALGTNLHMRGHDPFGVGALLHLALIGPILTDPFPTDAGGVGHAPAPIPANATLAGLQFYAQGVWLEQRTGHVCTASPLGLVTSRGLGVTIQP